MASGRALLLLTMIVAFAAAVSGCDVYDRPRRPLPANFEVHTLDGRVLTPKELRGKPWVINIWVPG